LVRSLDQEFFSGFAFGVRCPVGLFLPGFLSFCKLVWPVSSSYIFLAPCLAPLFVLLALLNSFLFLQREQPFETRLSQRKFYNSPLSPYQLLFPPDINHPPVLFPQGGYSTQQTLCRCLVNVCLNGVLDPPSKDSFFSGVSKIERSVLKIIFTGPPSLVIFDERSGLRKPVPNHTWPFDPFKSVFFRCFYFKGDLYPRYCSQPVR